MPKKKLKKSTQIVTSRGSHDRRKRKTRVSGKVSRTVETRGTRKRASRTDKKSVQSRKRQSSAARLRTQVQRARKQDKRRVQRAERTAKSLRKEIARLRKQRDKSREQRKRIEGESRGLFIKLTDARIREKTLIEKEAERIKVQYDRKEARRKERADHALSESQIVAQILERQEDESANDWIERVEKEMGRLGFHRDAWYSRGAELFDMTERDFYTLVVS